jgi:hypothetical protein
MTRVDFVAYLLLAWELVSEDAIHRVWECHSRDTELLQRELVAALAE